MNFNMILPVLEDAVITEAKEMNGYYHLHIELLKILQRCPKCGKQTSRIHDYRTQKIQHLKIFERNTYLFNRKRRYSCSCGKQFTEKNTIVERYQRHTIEWNQAFSLRVIQGKNFKDTAAQFRTSKTTVIRRFDRLSSMYLREVKKLPQAIARDEYKGDTNKGKYQLIITDAETGEPLDILPNRLMKMIKSYLRQKRAKVEIVVMDMSPVLNRLSNRYLENPLLSRTGFIYSCYILGIGSCKAANPERISCVRP